MMRTFLLAPGLVLLAACGTDSFGNADGGTDGSPSDGNVPEAPPPADGGAPDAPACGQFCATQTGAAFCSDFDEGSLTAGWVTDTFGTPTGVLDTKASTSCPASLLIDFPTQAAPTVDFPRYRLAKTMAIALANNNVVVTLDVKLPPLAQATSFDGGVSLSDAFELFAVAKATDPVHYNARIEHSADGFWFLRMGTGTSSESGAQLDPLIGAWNHMVLTAHFSTTGTGTAQLSYISSKAVMTVATANPSNVNNSDSLSGPLFFAIGAEALTSTSQDWKFAYDSVVLDAN